jgi:pimeloyl-ACP methyl ester carboxylesterase
MNYKIILTSFGFIVTYLSLILWTGCTKDNETTAPASHNYQRGDIVSVHTLGTYNPNDIENTLNEIDFQVPFTLEYSVEVISVNYMTVDAESNQIQVSGAIAIPMNKDNCPMLCIQHGTKAKRDGVASVSPTNSTEGIIGLITASMGYFTLIPDYPGFGISDVMHPYMHIESNLPCMIDFMKGGKSYSGNNGYCLNGEVFLTGYSEGGFLTLALQKAIEEQHMNEFVLTAVAPMSGPYDLKGMVDSVFLSQNYISTTYIGYFFTAYNQIYGWNRLDEIFNPTYANQMPGLFDGSKNWATLMNLLPENFIDLVHPDFIQAYNSGNEPGLYSALEDNTRLDWIPKTPIHFFHGDADQTVPIYHVLTAKERLSAKGETQIQLTIIPGGTHESSGTVAVVGAIEWFESLKTS